MTGPFPEDSAARKTYPVYSGVLRYFPAALAAVAHHSYLGNEKHNPGEALHWARGKSDDHLDAAARHLTEGDLKGAAWRILAALQLEEESKGAPMAPGARIVKPFPSAADLPDSPVVAAYLELHDEDAATANLTAGTAYMANYGANPVSQRDEE